MEGDGFPEIAYGATLFTTTGGAIARAWSGTGAAGGPIYSQLSTFADVDEDGDLELVAGRTAYRADGSILWDTTTAADGFPAIADLDGDGTPEVIVVGGGAVHVLAGATGVAVYPAFALPGAGAGGPPTVADFDGDGAPEIGVAQQNRYTVLEVNAGSTALVQLWSTPNHDLSSSVTGSTVFDFEGDGIAEVVYADECYLWVFDGPTGAVRFAAFTSSFTGTEASIVADVDGDGHAEMLLPSNAADPGPSTVERRNWEETWLDNFRQNVQETGLFDAPDATVTLEVRCTEPPTLVASIRNLGAALLPPNVQVDFFRVEPGGTETPLGTARTTRSIFPGALEQVSLVLSATDDPMDTYRARIVNPASMPTFRECREDNDTSADVAGVCVM
jgi:hypothetical protein